MGTNYASIKNIRKTHQSKPIPGRKADMKKNNAGGFAFVIDDWKRLERFLILGATGNTYYVKQKKLIKQNTKAIERCIKEDPTRVLNTLVEISEEGRASSNDPAIFVLALLMTYGRTAYKDHDRYSFDHLAKGINQDIAKYLPRVCRTGTHLFTFVHYVDQMRSWGRGLRKAVSNWYLSMGTDKLQYQVAKYQGRVVEEGSQNKWTHKDVLRLAHVKPETDAQKEIFKYIVKGELNKDTGLDFLWAIEKLHEINDGEVGLKGQIGLIKDNRIPHECWPTALKNEKKVWETALPNIPLGALIRNLGKLSNVGVLKTGEFKNISTVIAKLTDAEYVRKSRLHPLAVYTASKVYSQGEGIKGKLTWDPNRKILDALDKTFYLAFKNVEPTNKKICLALDVSSSMMSPVSGSELLSCREAAVLMAMVTARVEPNYEIIGFTASGDDYFSLGSGQRSYYSGSGVSQLNISPTMSIVDLANYVGNMNFGRTDCSLPMQWAQSKKINFDTFVILTDSETWYGDIHPMQALKNYRNQFVNNAKLVVVGMTATEFSIADQNDSNSLDVVGLDTNTPNLISSFIKGEI